jgi:hypothetical protein
MVRTRHLPRLSRATAPALRVRGRQLAPSPRFQGASSPLAAREIRTTPDRDVILVVPNRGRRIGGPERRGGACGPAGRGPNPGGLIRASCWARVWWAPHTSRGPHRSKRGARAWTYTSQGVEPMTGRCGDEGDDSSTFLQFLSCSLSTQDVQRTRSRAMWLPLRYLPHRNRDSPNQRSGARPKSYLPSRCLPGLEDHSRA